MNNVVLLVGSEGRIAQVHKKALNNLRLKFIEVANGEFDVSDVKEKISFADICTPTDTHYELVKYFLENNLNVFCEKPLALKTKETKELIRLSEETKTKLLVNIPYYFMYSDDLKKSNLSQHNFRYRFRNDEWVFQSDWMKDEDKSGGILYDLGSHFTPIISKLNNGEIKDVELIWLDRDDCTHIPIAVEFNVLGNIKCEVSLSWKTNMHPWIDLKISRFQRYNWEETAIFEYMLKKMSDESVEYKGFYNDLVVGDMILENVFRKVY